MNFANCTNSKFNYLHHSSSLDLMALIENVPDFGFVFFLPVISDVFKRGVGNWLDVRNAYVLPALINSNRHSDGLAFSPFKLCCVLVVVVLVCCSNRIDRHERKECAPIFIYLRIFSTPGIK